MKNQIITAISFLFLLDAADAIATSYTPDQLDSYKRLDRLSMELRHSSRTDAIQEPHHPK